MVKRTKLVAFVMVVGMSGALLSACANQPDETANNSPAKAENANMAAAKPPSDKGDNVVTGGDLAFMGDAAMGNMAEVELGHLAVKQGDSKDVKQFGQHMVDDHSKANEELKQLAQQKKVMPPPDVSPEQKQAMEKLTKLQGAEFDRAYVKDMVEDHVKDVTAFEAVSKNATDADVKAFATKTLPVLRQHLQMIQGIAAKMDVK
jgi:putative membrane protein